MKKSKIKAINTIKVDDINTDETQDAFRLNTARGGKDLSPLDTGSGGLNKNKTKRHSETN